MTSKVACFCGHWLEFEGDCAYCPKCGEAVTMTPVGREEADQMQEELDRFIAGWMNGPAT